MTIIEKIDHIYEKMFDVPLSVILPMVHSISLECKDYEGYCILSFWSRPLNEDVGINKSEHKEIVLVLEQEGLEKNVASKIVQDAFMKYIKLRSIDDDQLLILDAKEMEDTIKSFDNLLSAVEVPQGLHPQDLYFVSQNAEKGKFHIIEKKAVIEKQYAVLHGYITSKLTQYRRKLILSERKNKMEMGIANSKEIFIIHGHNEAKRRELESLLKERFMLEPIVLAEKPDQGLTIIEKFEKYASNCSYAFALFTPDDIVTSGKQQYFQARPNVIFELGWFYANLGRSRVCILDQESEQSKIFSDLQGIMRMQFKENISEKIMEIERELKSVGIIK
ncbi:MAG: nucleotide-binding protein [Lachnospiraceae bacterium]|nr:nucleotide-binding protein [Lachnospiraceae bacterium]